MRLAYHYHIPYRQTESGVLTPGYQGRFIDGLAKHCESIDAFLHEAVHVPIERLDYRLSSPNVRVVSLGRQRSVPVRELFGKKISQPFKLHRTEVDAVLLRGPSPLLPAMAASAGETPVAVLLVGDYTNGIHDLRQPKWRKSLIRYWAQWNKRRQHQAMKSTLCFVNSHELYEELSPTLRNVVEIRTTTLSEQDFFFRLDTCTMKPYRILYTGRIERGKGVLDIACAVANLADRGYDIEFRLAGWIEEGDTTLEELRQLAERRGISDKLHYLGFKPLGEELFSTYGEADIYVLASRASEGFPRTIWEAMASSLPVVATRVGSIPHFIEDASKLVEPNNVHALADAIEELILSPGLRRHLISRGMELARQNTMEVQTKKMVDIISDWVGKRS